MKPKHITVHCSATPPSQPHVGVVALRDMHMAKGWSDLGYHFVITRDGHWHDGRPITRQGAGVRYYNKDNVHICLVGGVDEGGKPEFNYTDQQMATLRYRISDLCSQYGIKQENIKGHRDWPNVAKACPCFDIQDKLKEWES